MSLVEKISLFKNTPKAEALRVLEARVDKFFDGTGDKKMTDAFSHEAKKHYGHAGIVFVQYYMNNREAVEQIEEKVRDRVDQTCQLSSSDRFWSEYITKALTAGIIANKLGLLSYDMKAVFNFAVLVRYWQTTSPNITAIYYTSKAPVICVVRRKTVSSLWLFLRLTRAPSWLHGMRQTPRKRSLSSNRLRSGALSSRSTTLHV
jgi:hypothetical protein